MATHVAKTMSSVDTSYRNIKGSTTTIEESVGSALAKIGWVSKVFLRTKKLTERPSQLLSEKMSFLSSSPFAAACLFTGRNDSAQQKLGFQ